MDPRALVVEPVLLALTIRPSSAISLRRNLCGDNAPAVQNPIILREAVTFDGKVVAVYPGLVTSCVKSGFDLNAPFVDGQIHCA